MSNVDEVLEKNVAKILPDKEGLKRLMDSKKIRVYLGVDPSGSKLHLGHSIVLHKLQEFANLGHEAILVFGTGTVLVGDPSQRAQTRRKITEEEIAENIKTWRQQAEKIIDFDEVQIKQNGDWLLKLTVPEIFNIASNISSVQLFKRDMFQERIKKGDTVWTHEALYPLFQGYDSVAMDVDLEIGGTDQTFNMLIGRELQKKMADREKFVLTTPLISGVDGKPMSKTSGNCIWLADSADEMYSKIMSISDSQIKEYTNTLTELSEKELKGPKPIDAKKRLAFEIVKIYHGEKEAQKAQEEFERVFQKRQKPQDIEGIKVAKSKWGTVNFLVENNLADSRSAAKRLIDQGAVEIDGKSVKENKVEFRGGEVIKIGKKTFARVILRQGPSLQA